MKKFLLLSAVLGLSIPVFAQVNNEQLQWGIGETFSVDLGKGDSGDPVAANEIAKMPANTFLEGQDIFNEKKVAQPTPSVSRTTQSGGLFPELGSVHSKQEKRGAEVIKLIIDDVKIIQPALNGHAFCLGTLTMENNLDVRIQKMELTLNYGGLDVPVSYSNIPPLGGKQTQNIAWLGDYCNSMLSIPQINVKMCVASTLSREQCQSKIEYKPIENE